MSLPFIRIIVSPVNRIEYISVETLLRSLTYNTNKSGPSSKPWGNTQVITLV